MEPISTLVLVAAFLAPVPITKRPDWGSYNKSGGFGTSTNDLVYATSVATESIVMEKPVDLILDARTRLAMEIQYYGSFEDGWDGEGSVRAAGRSVEETLNFISQLPGGLPLPGVMLSPSGEAGCYWDGDGGYADISFAEDGTASFFSRTNDGIEYFAESLNRETFTRNWFFDALGTIAAPKLNAA